MKEKGIPRVSLKVDSREEMNALYDYFKGDAPGTVRLRYFEIPILMKIDSLEFEGYSDIK